MKASRFVSLSLTFAISSGLLAGCGKSTESEVAENVESVITMEFKEMENFAEKPEDKIYEPYQHVFFYRYGTGQAEERIGGVITIPEGYEILQINNYNEWTSRGSETRGFDVWFINKEMVEVEAIYNEEEKHYEYCQPGKVINLEAEEENVLTKGGI